MKFLIDGQTLSTAEINRGIGIVFKSICEEMVANDISNEWLITVRDISDLKHFSKDLQRTLTPIIVSEALNYDNYLDQTKYYSQALNKVIGEYKIDAYWNPNPLMLNVVLPTDLCNTTIFLTIHDLIPLVMPDSYIDKWPKNQKFEYERRIENIPNWADRLVFVSESAKNDFEKLNPIVTVKSKVIQSAVDHTLFYSSLVPRDRFKSPYILFTGGVDPRKNMNAAIEAFSYLIKDNYKKFSDLKFYIVCACSDDDKHNYENLAAKLGVLDKLVMTGYIEEENLIALYKEASVLSFPSRYEGFGLPVLEALACGLPVVTTKISSIPEIIGDLAYYCSPDDTQDMAFALKNALEDSANGNIRKNEYIQRAKKFTWAKTGANYYKLFTNTLFNANNIINLDRPKIAYVSPWSPQRSGIANYSFDLVAHLKEYVDITLYLENQEETNNESLGLLIQDISLLPQDIEQYDCVIYHIGNNTQFHKKIYQLAWKYPSVIVLHDFNIHPFLADSFLGKEEENIYEDALIEGYGEVGKSSYASVKSGNIYPEIWRFPMSHALAKRSNATIVHSKWVKAQFQEIDNVFVVPHGSIENEKGFRHDRFSDLKKRFNIPPESFIISTFGFVNALKRIHQILEAIKILVDLGYPVKLFIGGELIDATLKVEEKIQSLHIGENVVISGYLNEEDFDNCIRMSDVVLNLRFPSMGESSGTLMKALRSGKACLVSNYQQFTEYPNSVCWKVDIDKDLEIPLMVAYLQELMRNPSARKQLGRNASFFAANYSSYELSAKLYAEIISKQCNLKNCSNLKTVILNLPQQVLLRIGEQSFDISGSSLDKSLIHHIEVNGCYEPHLQLALMSFISDGDLCIDVGANIGVHSILMSRLVGSSGQVYCYEASPDNHSYLKHNLEANNCANVTTEQVGLWEEETELEFSYVEEVAGCSFFSTSGVREGENALITCRPLDSLTAIYPLERRISLIKIDVEGSETYVIKGAIQTIRKHYPTILLEINPETLKRFFSSGFQELYQMIIDLGYSIHWIKSDGSLSELKTLDDLQLLFDREKLQWIDVACLFRDKSA